MSPVHIVSEFRGVSNRYKRDRQRKKEKDRNFV